MAAQVKTARKKAKGGGVRGRPSRYSIALADRICGRIAAGESLRSICQEKGMPHRATVLSWAMNPKHDFHDRYERAREIQIHSLVDDMTDIADNGANDWMADHNGNDVVNHENINRSKLRVQFRQWLAGKVLPRLYGDKVNVDHSGSVEVKGLDERLERARKRVKEERGHGGEA